MPGFKTRALVFACALLLIAAAFSAAASTRNTIAVRRSVAKPVATRTLTDPGAPTVDLSPNPGRAVHRSACVTAGAGPAGAFQCGELLLAHSMPSYRTLDRDRTLTLLYNSGTAKPSSIVMADVSLASGVSVPDRIDVSLVVDRTSYSTFTAASHSFSSAGFTSGGLPRRVAVGFDSYAAGLPTGAYPYRLHVTTVYGMQSYTTIASDTLIVVDRRNSPYGAGWGVAGVERIHSQSNGNLLTVGGDGTALLYEFIGDNQWLAPPGLYRDTIRWTSVSDGSVPTDTYFWRRELDGTRTFFNGAGLQQYVVDRTGQKVEYGYTSETDPSSGLTSVVIAPHGLGLSYTFAYTGGKLASITDPSGVRTMYTTINASNQLVAARDPGFAVGKEILFGYDTNQRLKSWRSRRGHTTKYGYHDAYFGATGMLRADTLPIAPAYAAFTPAQTHGLASHTGLNNTVRIDSAFVVVRGVRNEVAKFLVNGDNAPTTIINPAGTVSVLSYHAGPPLLVTRIAQPAQGVVRRMGYDVLGRLSWVQDSTHSQGPVQTDYVYGNVHVRDKPTQVTADRDSARDVTTFVYDSVKGWLNSVTDPRGKTTSFSYFANGQVETVTNPLSQSTHFTYNSSANLESVTTHMGNVTEYTYDEYNQVRTHAAPASGVVTIFRNVRLNQQDSVRVTDATYGLLTTKFLYDDDGNLTRRTDPKGIARNWTYNAHGFATVMTDETGAYEQRTYTPDGLPLTVTNRDGSMIGIDYDAMGRQTYKELQPSLNYGGSYDEITTHYDALGRDTLIENTNSRILRTYRPEGTLWTEEQYLKFSEAAGKTFKYEYTYNKGGARAKMKMLIDGVLQREVDYGRGADNLFTSLAWAGKTLTIGYDDLGRRQHLNLPFGDTATFTYDGDGRFQRMKVDNYIDHNFTSFDGFGRPLALIRVDHSDTHTGNWTYDLQGQIKTTSQAGSSSSYEYDKAGNRTRETLDQIRYLHSYVPDTNRLDKRCAANTSWVCISGGAYDQYSYNENGDMTRKQTHTGLDIPYFRTAAGQITTLFATTVQYRYDGLGRMVMRRDGQSMNQITSYDGNNVAWHNGAFFLHGDGVDDPLVLSMGSDCYYATQAGRMLAYLTHGGGDCSTNWEDIGKFAGAIANSWGFGLNRSHESYSELSFFRNRWYDAKTGRFTQEDPIGFAGGSNLYAYAGNNPATYTDPFGLCTPWPDCLLQAAANWGAQRGGAIGSVVLNAAAGVNAASEAFGLNDFGRAAAAGNVAGGAFALAGMLPAGRLGKAAGLVDGTRLPVNSALDAASDFLGAGYREVSAGRFLSADGLRAVRMGVNDILGRHGKGPHMNFETLAPNPAKPGKNVVTNNMHIYLDGQ